MLTLDNFIAATIKEGTSLSESVSSYISLNKERCEIVAEIRQVLSKVAELGGVEIAYERTACLIAWEIVKDLPAAEMQAEIAFYLARASMMEGNAEGTIRCPRHFLPSSRHVQGKKRF